MKDSLAEVTLLARKVCHLRDFHENIRHCFLIYETRDIYFYSRDNEFFRNSGEHNTCVLFCPPPPGSLTGFFLLYVWMPRCELYQGSTAQ